MVYSTTMGYDFGGDFLLTKMFFSTRLITSTLAREHAGLFQASGVQYEGIIYHLVPDRHLICSYSKFDHPFIFFFCATLQTSFSYLTSHTLMPLPHSERQCNVQKSCCKDRFLQTFWVGVPSRVCLLISINSISKTTRVEIDGLKFVNKMNNATYHFMIWH